MGRRVRATRERLAGEQRGRQPATTWDMFEPRLTKALARMATDTFLIVSARPFEAEESYYVQFGQGGRMGFVAEAISNAYLSGSKALSSPQETRMVELGWQEPGLGREEDQNYRREWPLEAPFAEVARLAVRTLREVYGVDSPVDLVYRRFGGDGRDFAEPLLGIEQARLKSRTKKRAREEEETGLAELHEMVGRTICEFIDVDEVPADDAGNFYFEAGSAGIVASVLDGDPPVVQVWSPVLTNVGGSPELLEAINDINAGITFARVVWDDGDVAVVLEVPAIGITGESIAFACGVVASVSDEIDEGLREAFGSGGSDSDAE